MFIIKPFSTASRGLQGRSGRDTFKFLMAELSTSCVHSRDIYDSNLVTTSGLTSRFFYIRPQQPIDR